MKKLRLYGIGSKISTYFSIVSFGGPSPTTSYSHRLEDQLQHVQEENKMLRDQFKDLRDQHQKMQEEMQRQMKEHEKKF